jgi:hypothetical protein
VGRREEGREEELFKASLNGEGEEIFLESLEYMVVMVSADAVHSPKAHIYCTRHRGQSALPATPLPLDQLFFLGCAQARQTTRSLIFEFCTKE